MRVEPTTRLLLLATTNIAQLTILYTTKGDHKDNKEV
jgi:hypothetical protein